MTRSRLSKADCQANLTTITERRYSPLPTRLAFLAGPNLLMTPSVDFSKSVGYDLGDQPVSWQKRDCLLYNVSLYPFSSSSSSGAKPEEELNYLYEKSKAFRVIPSYPLVLPLKGATSEVNDFAQMVAGRGAVDGFPTVSGTVTVIATPKALCVRAITEWAYLPLLASPARSEHHSTRRAVA